MQLQFQLYCVNIFVQTARANFVKNVFFVGRIWRKSHYVWCCLCKWGNLIRKHWGLLFHTHIGLRVTFKKCIKVKLLLRGWRIMQHMLLQLPSFPGKRCNMKAICKFCIQSFWLHDDMWDDFALLPFPNPRGTRRWSSYVICAKKFSLLAIMCDVGKKLPLLENIIFLTLYLLKIFFLFVFWIWKFLA